VWRRSALPLGVGGGGGGGSFWGWSRVGFGLGAGAPGFFLVGLVGGEYMARTFVVGWGAGGCALYEVFVGGGVAGAGSGWVNGAILLGGGGGFWMECGCSRGAGVGAREFFGGGVQNEFGGGGGGGGPRAAEKDWRPCGGGGCLGGGGTGWGTPPPLFSAPASFGRGLFNVADSFSSSLVRAHKNFNPTPGILFSLFFFS